MGAPDKREAIDTVARQLVENSQQNGTPVTFDQARARVADAVSRGDNKRSNQNR